MVKENKYERKTKEVVESTIEVDIPAKEKTPDLTTKQKQERVKTRY